MNRKIEISVILPVFNGGEYLNAAIDSILKQSFEEFELLIINDGSTDDSWDIIARFAKSDKRVIAFNSGNRGLITQLNFGIDRARGRYIARMDADDVSHKDRFIRQLQFMSENKLDLCGTFYKIIDQNGNYKKKVELPEKDDEILLALARRCPFAHGSIMGSVEVFRRHRYSETHYSTIEDYFLWTRMAMSNVKMGNVPELLFEYRVHDTAFTNQKLRKMIADARKLGSSYFIAQKCLIKKLVKSNNVNSRTLTDIILAKFMLGDKFVPLQYYLYHPKSLIVANKEYFMRKYIERCI